MATSNLGPEITHDEVRARLDRFESRYGVPSERLADAFRDDGGELVETDDFAEWSMAWTIWRHIQAGSRVG